MDVLGAVAGAAAIGFIAYAVATRKNKHVKHQSHDHHKHQHEKLDDHLETTTPVGPFGGTVTKSRRRRRRKAWR